MVAVALSLSMAFAESYVNANDLKPGTFTDVQALEDGFSLIGTADKPVEVGKADNVVYKDETFTQRIKLGGSGKVDARCVGFSAKSGQTVTVLGHSSSKTDTRVVIIADESGKPVGTVDVTPYSGAPALGTVKIKADGKYFAYSKSSGIYIYEITVK